MINRREFGKLGIGLAAATKFSPFLIVSRADAQSQATGGEGRDIRRVGVRSNGTYWGAGSEKVDLLSGNLCYSLPLVGAQSRNCSAVVQLSYNSQLWKQGIAGPKAYGSDSGVGFGWRLQIASITPEMSSGVLTGVRFMNGTGAEYHMKQDGSVWRSLHGHYITWDPLQSVLWFANGSSMTFGSVVGPHEADAGTLYPTLIQDTNGNQILISYLAGMGQAGSNSSGRISQIQDARAGFAGAGQFSYVFLYNSDIQPRLMSIVNTVGSLENYTFTYAQQQVSSPFAQVDGASTVTMLASLTNGTGLQHIFRHNGNSELVQAQKPQGGILGWSYRTFSFADGRAIREVSSRSLSDPYSPSNTHTHSFDRDPSDGTDVVHSSVTVTGPTASAQKTLGFASDSGSQYLGHAISVAAMSGGKVARQKYFAWSSTDAGIPYVSNQTTVLDPGAASQKTSSHQIARDAYGNVVLHSLFDYDNASTPARTTKHKHLADQAYLDRHILNRRKSSTVHANDDSLEVHSLQYDTTPIVDRPGLTQHASATHNAGNTVRGNVTESYVSGVYHRVQYDITGTPSVIQDSTQGQVSLIPEDGSNNARLGMIIPNGNADLGMQVEYADGKPVKITTPNGNQTISSYDALGRPSAIAYSNGRTVSYGYDNGPTTITSSINGRWKKATLGGFGHVIKSEVGDESGTHGVVRHVHGPTAYAPMGRLIKKSLPHVPGAEPQWIGCSYDDLGRKTSQDSEATGAPTKFSYSGNSVKTTDPSGRWKKIHNDASGKIKKVVLPDADGSGQLETHYSYNALGKLTSVAMPRANATQTRSFTYDAGGRVIKKQHAESGPKTAVYNTDGTLASMTDAKGQKHVYTRDDYKRITSTARFNSKGDPLPNETYSYYHDTNPFDPAFSQNALGRLAAVQWGSVNTLPGLMTEMYSYTVSGQIAAKRLRVNRGGNNADLELHIAYDGEARITSVTYPFGDPTLSYSYDSMGRLKQVSTASDAVVKDVLYDSSGNLTSMKLFAKNVGQYLVQGYEYNTRNRVTRVFAAPADQSADTGKLPRVDLQYAYRSDDGKLQSQTDNVAGTSVAYDYDNHGRIASAMSSDAAWGLEYDYDSFGNRTGQTVTQGQGYSHQVEHDPLTNWMLDSSTGYDANGNIVLLPNMQMKYDAQNRLIRVDSINGTEKYGYDPKNMRVWTSAADGSESLNFYHGTKSLASYALVTDAAGNLFFNVNKTNIYFGSHLAQSGGEVMVADRLGSTRAWSAKKGAKTASYMPFGEKVQGPDNKESKFDGYEEDVATGLKYAEQRYYSSTLGRFMSPDPYDKSAHMGSPESWNRYAFVSNDPINRTDPHGLNDSGGGNSQGGGGQGGSGGGSWGQSGYTGSGWGGGATYTINNMPIGGPLSGEGAVQIAYGADQDLADATAVQATMNVLAAATQTGDVSPYQLVAGVGDPVLSPIEVNLGITVNVQVNADGTQTDSYYENGEYLGTGQTAGDQDATIYGLSAVTYNNGGGGLQWVLYSGLLCCFRRHSTRTWHCGFRKLF